MTNVKKVIEDFIKSSQKEIELDVPLIEHVALISHAGTQKSDDLLVYKSEGDKLKILKVDGIIGNPEYSSPRWT